MTFLVVDASVAVKWVLDEPATEHAVALRASDRDLIAPSLVHAEIGSALWRAVLRGDVTPSVASNALKVASHITRASSFWQNSRTTPSNSPLDSAIPSTIVSIWRWRSASAAHLLRQIEGC